MLKYKQQGFTLIELVMIIVILGILSATALPKFINIQSDANKAVLSGIEGALKDVANMAHAKLLVLGKAETDNFVNMLISENQKVTMWGGYPHVGSENGRGVVDEPDIISILNISGDIEITRAGRWFNGTATFSIAPNCYVVYSEVSYDSGISGPFTPYQISKDESGC